MADYLKLLTDWIETLRGSKRRQVGTRTHTEEALPLTVRRAMEKVRSAARDDESIAAEANAIVRRGLDKRCITYEEYKLW